MPFQKPKILTESKLNTIRGKALVGHATPAEIMAAFSHFDLVLIEVCDAADSMLEMFSKGHAVDHFNWGASALTGEDIVELNEKPPKLRAAVAKARGEA